MSHKDVTTWMSDMASSDLVNELKNLIATAKQHAQRQVNAQMTLLYWELGRTIQNHILSNQRADYAKQVVKLVAQQLTQEYGKGFNEKSLRRMMQFYQAYPEHEIVATLSRQLNWSHLVELDRTDIHVGEYLTALPSKEQLQNKLHQVMASRLDAVSDATDLAKGE